jgi:hypothetical protein
VIENSLADLRSHLYEAYATQHADCGRDKAAALINQCDIRPLLPRARCCSLGAATDGHSEKISAEKRGMPAKRRLTYFYSSSKSIDPISCLLRALGRAPNVKARPRPVSQLLVSLQENRLD